MARSKVTVSTSAIADRYADEKIIEVSSPGGGCLIAFRLMDDDKSLRIEVYRADESVTVTGPARWRETDAHWEDWARGH